MKNLIATAMMLLIFVLTVSAQKQYSKEEKTIIGLIQQHYDHWKNRDYEKWTETWVHEDYVRYTRTLPYNLFERKGWEEVSAMQKTSIENNPEKGSDVDFWQFDYIFVIRDNMAIVKFDGENGLHTTSVFEKVKGTWKYISNEQVNKPMFDAVRDKNRLGNFEGDWQMIPGSFKWENSDSKMEITNYVMSVSRTLTGVDISEKISTRNAQQNIINIVEDISIVINSPSGELILTTVTSWPNGWTLNTHGKAKVTGKSIELNGADVGNEKNTYNAMINRKASDIINVSWTMRSGEKWSADLKLDD